MIGGGSGQANYSDSELATGFKVKWTSTASSYGTRCLASTSVYTVTTMMTSGGSTSRLTVLRNSTGETVWQEATARRWQGCPVIDGDTVLARSFYLWMPMEIRAYSLSNGTFLWSSDSGSRDSPSPVTTGSSLIVSDVDSVNRADCGNDGGGFWGLTALSIANGTRLWSYPTVDEGRSIASGTRVLALRCDGDLTALDATTGAETWSYHLTATQSAYRIWADSDTVFIWRRTSVFPWGYPNTWFSLVALNISNGSLRWTRDFDPAISGSTGGMSSSADHVILAVQGSDLSSLGTDDSTAIVAVSRSTGSVVWTKGVPSGTTINAAFDAPIVSDNFVLTGSSIRNSTTGDVVREVTSAQAPFSVSNGYLVGWTNTTPSNVVMMGPPSIPGPPGSAAASASYRSAWVSWTAPSDDGGTPITGYRAVGSPSGSCSAAPTDSGCRIEGLNNGTNYTFTVYASNALGEDPIGRTTEAVTPFEFSSGSPGGGSAGSGSNSGGCSSLPKPSSGDIGVSINDGAVYTNSPDVSLNLTWPACTAMIRISNDGGFKNASAKTPSNTIDWRLQSSGPERLPKTVYVRFGALSTNFTDDIILDETDPTLSSIDVSTAESRAGHPNARSKTGISVTTVASDKTSGVGKIQITSNKKKPGRLLKYAKTVKASVSGSTIWVRVQDRAGNFSAWKQASI